MTARKAAKKGARRRSDDLLKAISHEVRMDILRICSERESSPNQLAEEIGEDLNLVSYHVKILKEEGALELTRTVPRRGALEHFYIARVPAMYDEAAWAKLPTKQKPIVYRTILQAQMVEAAAAEADRSFDAADAHLSWVVLELDEEGRGDLGAALADALATIERIKATSAARLAKSGGRGEEMVTSIMGYERAARPGRG